MHRAHHLQDDRLFDCYLAERGGEPLDPPVAEHLADCAACGARYAELARFMDGAAREGDAEADAIFTPERLRAQQQQIARRLEHVGRAGARHQLSRAGSSRRTHRRARRRAPAPRWIAAAAAAGLFVGVARRRARSTGGRASAPAPRPRAAPIARRPRA